MHDFQDSGDGQQPPNACGGVFGLAERRQEREHPEKECGQGETKTVGHQSGPRIYRAGPMLSTEHPTILDTLRGVRMSWLVSLAVAALAATAIAANVPPADWPGFRGPGMDGLAIGARLPERWSKTANVKWAVDVPGRGWSSPVVAGDTVFITSAISSRPFKQPTPGIYGNDFIAEMRAQGLPSAEINKRLAGFGLGTSGAGTPESTGEFIRREQEKWRALAQELNIEKQ